MTARLEAIYRRSALLSWSPLRRAVKAPFQIGIRLIEFAQGFRTSPWDNLPYRFRFLTGKDEPETRQILERVCRRGQVGLDIGAHVGYVSRMLAILVGPDGIVFSFEPNPRLFRILKGNARRWPNVLPTNIALGGASGSATLIVPEGASMMGFLDRQGDSVRREKGEVVGEFPVVVRTGDDFMMERGVKGVDLVKIDVEGAECDVLDGLRLTMGASRHLVVIIELNPPCLARFGKRAIDLFRILWGLGFDTYECGKYTARRVVADERDVAALEHELSRGYTNIVGFKGFSDADRLRVLSV